MNTSGIIPFVLFGGDGSRIAVAAREAQKTFRYFWRELIWERRRIIRALDLACVKIPFFDDGDFTNVEHMWISGVQFDGKMVSGELDSVPRDLVTVKRGDRVQVPFSFVGDWMYVIQDRAYGGYTVDIIRSAMSPAEREDHDTKWGLDFGTIGEILLCPEINSETKGFFSRVYSKLAKSGTAPLDDHPMSISMGPTLSGYLEKNPGQLNHKDENGWTMLHTHSLAGSQTSVEILLNQGADCSIRTNHGMTALDLAESLQWEAVMRQLNDSGV